MSSPDNPQFDPQAPSAQTPVQSDIHGQPYSAPAPMPASKPPVENPVWSGWDVLLIAALTFVVVIALQLASVKAAQLLWFPRSTFYQAAQKVEQKPILVIVAQFFIYAPVALLMIALVEGKYHVPFWRSIGWQWPERTWFFLGTGTVLFLLLAALEIMLPTPKEGPFQHLFDRPLDAYLLMFIAVTLGPLMEELFFRGFLYPVLARRLGLGWGVFLSALPFAALHLPQYGWAWQALLLILIVGIVLGLVRARTKSVAASFLVHVGYNAPQMVIAVVATHGFRHLEKAALFLY